MFETIRKAIGSVRGRRPGASGLDVESGEPPLRQELFGLTLLESHARALANSHELDSRPGGLLLLPRLDENEEIIRRSYEDIVGAIRRGRPVSPAAEWLLDNYYLIEEQIDHIRSRFPPGYSRALPRLRSGDMQGFPRVYDLALELVSHTDGGIDLDNLSHFTKAYQGVHPLRLGELWAIPIMVALALIENLRRVAYRIAWRRRLRDLALQWAGQFLRVVQENPKSLITVLADFVRSNPPMSAPFLAELAANLQGTHPSLGLVINWMDQELAERGQTLELFQQAESHDQAADHASIGNIITSLRDLSTIDWRDFVESLSDIEAVLRHDPGGVYARTDFHSRDRCRREVEDLARRSRQEEPDVAEAAVRLARQRLNKPGVDQREATVAYFLLDNGRVELEAQIGYRPALRRRIERLLRRRALRVYLCTIGILTAVTAAPLVLTLAWAAQGWTGWLFGTVAALLLLTASRTAVSLTNWAITLLLPPRGLLQLDFSKGIPPDQRTAVIVPALLSSPETASTLLEHLEIRYLANRSPNLVMVLLSDFPDAATETTPADQPVLEATLARVRQLNAQYGAEGEDVFYLLHRRRLWNPAERRWMAYERKRGKVEQFNRLVRSGDTSPFSMIEGDVEGLRGVRYAIALDADTDLPPQSVWKMVGALAHPLNRPVLDGRSRCVVRGYGVLQPRVAVSLAASQRSPFARLFAGDVGLDPYTREVSNVHHDLFGEGQFIGKGIYDVEAFDAAAGRRFPENRILSHDLIEGCHARCGFLNDVEVLEDHPARYLTDASRRRRWTRGDWQIARWVLPSVPGPDGTRYPNPLGPLARWMILDNLRRTLVPASLTATFVLGWFLLPALAAAWTLLMLGLYFLPDCARSLRTLYAKPGEIHWTTHLRHAALKELRGWAGNLLDLLFAPFHAVLVLGAVWRTGWRLWVSRRRLLEWQTAADVEDSARTSLAGTYLAMWPAPALAILLGAWAIALAFPSILSAWPFLPGFGVECTGPLIATLPVAAAWLFAPAMAWLISRPPGVRAAPLTAGQRAFLSQLARRTWAYFDHLAGQENHWLPPDNIQEDPPIGQAHRTSPTNIGMLLLGNLAALDFGYLCPGQLLERTDKTFRTLEDLPRYQGHFYNWYDTRSLQPALPRYISTADSGNLQATLIVLRVGLADLPDRPILSERWREGLEDAVRILMEAAAAPADDSAGPAAQAARHQIDQALSRPLKLATEAPATLEGTHGALAAMAGALAELEPALAGENVLFWTRQLRRQCEDWRDEIAHLAPWVATGADSGGAAEAAVGLDGIPSLRQLARWSGAAPPATRIAAGDATSIRTPVGAPDGAGGASAWRALAAERAAGRLAAIEDLQDRCSELAEMDFTFLYDPSRNLLAIGYNLDTHRRDPGYYDLLASEARLCSFVGIARGQLPLKHWFHLGRQLAPGGGRLTLVSWSGSMFEYLMPLLLMPDYDRTLLHESYRGAVARQIRHGARHGIPWGFSESCYNQVDVQKAYQYRAFGVPGLGLKRGLDNDLVVAPYATVLALMIEPVAACRNLQAMTDLGFLGRYGFYEAVDYTPSRVPRGDQFAVVRNHMAHHSGMSLLSMASVLLGQPMQRRFLGDAHIRASLLLLQERIPVAQIQTRIGSAPEGADRQRGEAPASTNARCFTRADTPGPEVHMLSNGRYHVMVTAAGGGSSRWEDLALTRWREDPTRDCWGTFVYVRDVDAGEVWSTTAQPAGGRFDQYEVTFSPGVAEFRSVRSRIEVQTRIAVSPEDDVELRRMTISNLSGHNRRLEITTYAEAVILNGPDASEQPAFHGLFTETRIAAEKAAILCTRRTKSPEETWPCFVHGLLVHGVPAAEGVSFETDRAQFLGRRRSAVRPAALERSGPLSGTQGYVLDPVMAIRRTVVLEPGQSVTVDGIWGVGPDPAKALSLLDKYYDPRLADRVFDLAWTHSQVLMYQLRATEADAQLFTRMAGSLCYANPVLRARPSLIARNRKGQSSLWAYGVSGDLPIVLLRVADQIGLDLVRQMIQAHAYWRHKGLRVELVILAEAYSGYRQSLLDAIIGLVNSGPETKVLDQPAGIFVRNIEQVPEDDHLLLQAVSRIVLSDRRGTLAEQLERQAITETETPTLKPASAPERTTPAEQELAPRDLVFFNGLGGFTADGREYVILLKPGTVTPAPWANVLANPTFGSVVTESGGAYTWYQNAHEFRLTPWYSDAVTDLSGEAFYVRDEETGAFWSPMPGPTRGTTPYVARHGLGYSAFEHTQHSIAAETFTYVAMEAPVKFTVVTLRNLSSRRRRLSVTGYVEWVLGESRERHSMHVVTRLDPLSGAVFAWNPYKPDFGQYLAFFHCSSASRTLTTSRTEFLGRNGSPAAPAALRRTQLSNRAGAGPDPCAAIQTVLEIPPGEQVQVVFVLGAAEGEGQARSLLAQFGGVDGARLVLEGVWQFWKHNLGGIHVETPDDSVNVLVNQWLLYQVWACRFWGRSGYYQSGGAFGFRDQLQDSLAFLWECPWLTRQHLLTCAARQFREGDVQHWWHPPSGRGVRTRISDDYLWLPYVACRYVAATGDTGVLDELAPFLEAPALAPAEESRYGLPQISGDRASLYEHCVRALKHGLRFGPHGLPLMGGGDWNDGMNRVGRGGKGESIWLAFFLYETLRSFAELAHRRGDHEFADKCRAEADRLRQRIEANAWDGQWYLRAFFDDGRILGSHNSPQCQVDLLPQAWAVLSGAADPARAAQALGEALERLVDAPHRVVRLFDPPFDGTEMDPGYIRGYVPGVRENGGQYTHAAVWAAIALARSHKAEEAWRLFSLLNPLRHGDTPEDVAAYKVEPYVVAADVYAARGHEGRGGWTWYTGSAGWMYQLLVGELLGFRLEVDTLSFAPVLPPAWEGFLLHYRYRNTFYHIRIVRVGAQTWQVRRVLLDDVEQADRRIHLIDDRREHQAIVEVGQSPVPTDGP